MAINEDEVFPGDKSDPVTKQEFDDALLTVEGSLHAVDTCLQAVETRLQTVETTLKGVDNKLDLLLKKFNQ
ncbi:unnamed protein product [Rotaria socialis]